MYFQGGQQFKGFNFQPLTAENGTFLQPEVKFIYKIPAFKENPKQQETIYSLICIVLKKQTNDGKRYIKTKQLNMIEKHLQTIILQYS